jgi:hypothetical protein
VKQNPSHRRNADPVEDSMAFWMSRGIPIGLAIATLFFIKDLLAGRWRTDPDVFEFVSHVLLILTLAVSTVCLIKIPTRTLRLLRTIEFSCLAAIALFVSAYQLTDLGTYASLLSATNDYETGLIEAVSDGFSLRWAFVIAGYVAFVPNPIKRSVVAITLMALVPLSITVVFCQYHGAPFDLTLGLVLDAAIWMVGFAAVALFTLKIVDITALGRRALGRYVDLELIGEGGMGVVYSAKHNAFGQRVALKFPHDKFLQEPRVMRYFRREVEAMAALNHPHLVRVYYYEPGRRGRPYFVMELLAGVTLQKLVERYGPLPPGRALYVIRQVCAALGAVHERGWVHRDVKPVNIMICNHCGVFDFVKLLDLGVLHEIGSAAGVTPHTVAGTLAYMSPEQRSPVRPLDGRSDVFSVGAVLFFLLTGRFFANETKVDPDPPDGVPNAEPLHSLSDAGCPEEVRRLIAKCTEEKPDKRFQHVGELIDELDRLLRAYPWDNQQASAWWLPAKLDNPRK